MTAAERTHLDVLDEAANLAEKSLSALDPHLAAAALLRAAANVAVRHGFRRGLFADAARDSLEHASHAARSRVAAPRPSLRIVE